MNGIILIFVDQNGSVIAMASDFDPSAPCGTNLEEMQTSRATERLARQVIEHYSYHPLTGVIDGEMAVSLMREMWRKQLGNIHKIKIVNGEPVRAE